MREEHSIEIEVCRGAYCSAKGGGCKLADLLNKLRGGRQVNITTVACTNRHGVGAPTLKMNGQKRVVDPTEAGCLELLASLELEGRREHAF